MHLQWHTTISAGLIKLRSTPAMEAGLVDCVWETPDAIAPPDQEPMDNSA